MLGEFPNNVLEVVTGVELKENDGKEGFTDEVDSEVELDISGLEPNRELEAAGPEALLSTLPNPKTGGPEVPPPTTPHAKV